MIFRLFEKEFWIYVEFEYFVYHTHTLLLSGKIFPKRVDLYKIMCYNERRAFYETLGGQNGQG